MFTQITRALRQRVLGSDLLDLLTGPHGVDRYTELVAPTWTGEARAKVIDVRRTTPRSVTLTLAPNEAFTSRYTVKAGQYVNLTVDIDGRRHTRCYSPANAEGDATLELTIGRHEGGLVTVRVEVAPPAPRLGDGLKADEPFPGLIINGRRMGEPDRLLSDDNLRLLYDDLIDTVTADKRAAEDLLAGMSVSRS